VRAAEDYWFDATRSVRTSKITELESLHLAGERRDGFMYMPARVKNARAALRALPVTDYRSYRFIDVGSGAGRVLFLAAEYPFKQIEGVELATELHDLAVQNIRRFRFYSQRCHDIRSINASAVDYEFPNENLVIFLFNPFGAEVLSDVIRNLDASLRIQPRDAIVLMLYPEFGYIMDTSRALELYQATTKYRMYRSTRSKVRTKAIPPSSSASPAGSSPPAADDNQSTYPLPPHSLPPHP
jgi:SAM-dependent methyltransferase